MISNKMIVDGMKEALTRAFTAWLNENRDALMKAVSSSLAVEAQAGRREPAEPPPKKFFTPRQLAARWNLHHVSVLRVLRLGDLPSLRVGRRILV